MTEDIDTRKNDQVTDLPVDEQPVFDSPWQARAFALAVVLSDHQQKVYSWNEFQERLAAEVQQDSTQSTSDYSESVYYEQWLRALERLLLDENVITTEKIQQRVAEFAAGDRDASEFVEGEHKHHHDDGHDHHHH